nr:hypothetical protein [Tanacetum cinerariifolium]
MFEKSSTSNTSCRDDDFHLQRHDDHQEDDGSNNKNGMHEKRKQFLMKIRYLYNKDLFLLKNGNTEEKKYILSLYKIHVESFPEADLEEKINR